MALKPIEILKDTIESVAHRIEIDSVVSLGSNQYRINTCNTLYLRTYKKVTIDGVEYEVVDFTINEYITVEATDGTDQPVTVEFFDIPVPLFIFGSPKLVSGELVKRISNGDVVWPYIWLVEISNTQGTLDPAAAVTLTPSFNLFFLDSNDKYNWSIQEHYDNDVYVMSNYINFFIDILKSRRDIYDSDSITYTTTNHVNFGDYIVDQGNDTKILNDDVTGVQLQLDLPILIDSCDCKFKVTPNCPVITETFNTVAISSPLSFKNIVVQTDDAIPVQTGTILIDTSESLVIQVAASAGGDAANILNGTTLTPIPAGGTKNFFIRYPDLSLVPLNILVDNANIVTATIPDADPAENQVNGDSKTDIPSGGSKNFVIRDQDSNTVTVTEVSDSATEFVGEVTIPDTPLNTANLFKTGQTTSYRPGDDGTRQEGRGVDFKTLDFNNPFGNTNRFTDTAGGQNYDGTGGSIADVIVDWAYWNQVDETVQLWYRVTTAGNWNNAIDGALAFSVSIWSDWWLPNKMEMSSVTWYEMSGSNLILLNYAPFNIDITGMSERLWTGTRGETSGRYFNLAENGILLFSTSSSSLSWIPTTRIPITDLIP